MASAAAKSGWIWTYQPWHIGATAPQFTGTQVHRYENLQVRHKTKTAFFASPTCGFVQMLRFKQSSLYLPLLLLRTPRTGMPAAVMLACLSACADGRPPGPEGDRRGQEFP